MQALANKALEEIWGKPPALASLEKGLQTNGYRNVSRIVAKTRGKHPELHLTEDYVNVWGYRLLADKPEWALGLFQYNAEQWPKSWNAFDSLAEAYESLGDKPRAIINYKKSLALDPNNKNAVEHLRKLQAR